MFSRFESGDLSEEADEHNESSNESIEFEYNIKKEMSLIHTCYLNLIKVKNK
jgi:hypothetical protein